MRSSIDVARNCSAPSSTRILKPPSLPNSAWLSGRDSYHPMTEPTSSTSGGDANPVDARPRLGRG